MSGYPPAVMRDGPLNFWMTELEHRVTHVVSGQWRDVRRMERNHGFRVVSLAFVMAGTTAFAGEVGLASSPASLSPAQADPCPPAVAIDGLDDLAGQELTGLTVERGTVPDEFTAEFLGVIENGIAPGLPMVVVNTQSEAITRIGGVWAGMSGAPVSSEDGRLVGSVSYGLSFGASPIAGVTPAAEMQKLSDGGGVAAPAAEVELTGGMQEEIVASGAATAKE